MFSWPRVNPSNWRWKQLQKLWPTAQHRLKKSQRGVCSQPRGWTNSPSLQVTPTWPHRQVSALHGDTAPCNELPSAMGYQGRYTAKLAENQTKCKKHLEVKNIPNLILFPVKAGPEVGICRTKCSSCYNTWEKEMTTVCWCGGSTASTTTTLVPHPSVLVPKQPGQLGDSQWWSWAHLDEAQDAACSIYTEPMSQSWETQGPAHPQNHSKVLTMLCVWSLLRVYTVTHCM